MISVMAGELSPVVTGLVYCSVIAYCQDLFQLSRAQAWTEALTGWCEQQPEMVAHTGQCLVHRAEVSQLRGDWPAWRCRKRSGQGHCSRRRECRLAHALYRQGEVHRLQGHFDQAEPRIVRPPDPVTTRSQDSRCCDSSRDRRPLRPAQSDGRFRRPPIRFVAPGCFQQARRSSSANGDVRAGPGGVQTNSNNHPRAAVANCSTRWLPTPAARWISPRENRKRRSVLYGEPWRHGGSSRSPMKRRASAY